MAIEVCDHWITAPVCSDWAIGFSWVCFLGFVLGLFAFALYCRLKLETPEGDWKISWDVFKNTKDLENLEWWISKNRNLLSAKNKERLFDALAKCLVALDPPKEEEDSSEEEMDREDLWKDSDTDSVDSDGEFSHFPEYAAFQGGGTQGTEVVHSTGAELSGNAVISRS